MALTELLHFTHSETTLRLFYSFFSSVKITCRGKSQFSFFGENDEKKFAIYQEYTRARFHNERIKTGWGNNFTLELEQC